MEVEIHVLVDSLQLVGNGLIKKMNALGFCHEIAPRHSDVARKSPPCRTALRRNTSQAGYPCFRLQTCAVHHISESALVCIRRILSLWRTPSVAITWTVARA